MKRKRTSSFRRRIWVKMNSSPSPFALNIPPPPSTVDTSGEPDLRRRAAHPVTDRLILRLGAAAAPLRSGTSCTMFLQELGREGDTCWTLLFHRRSMVLEAPIGLCLRATTPTYSAPTLQPTVPTTTPLTATPSTSPPPKAMHAAATTRRRSAHSGSLHRPPPFPTNDSSTPRMRLSVAQCCSLVPLRMRVSTVRMFQC